MDTGLPWKIADLIVAELEGSITEDQHRQLEEWVHASLQHEILYEKIQKQEHFECFTRMIKRHNYQPRYEEFCRHVAQVRRRRWMKRMQYAAIILMPLFFLGWWYSQQKQSIPDQQEYILPGHYQAILTLPDGETIRLSENHKKGQLKKTNAYFDQDMLSYEVGDKMEKEVFHRINIPRGGEYMLKLADGTQVWLNAETELHYPTAFNGTERKVSLRGEAYFQVAHDSLHPFIVETGNHRLTVLGTSFGLRAYEDEERILTTLETGKVRVETDNQQVILNPGEQSRYENNIVYVGKVNTSLYTAWHKGKYVFYDQPLEEILQTLGRWYDIDVVFQGKDLGKIRMNGELPRYGDIQDFLKKIEMLEKVKFDVKGKRVTVLKY